MSPCNKPLGVCGVCQIRCRVRGDGALYRHGGKAKGSQCSGSGSIPGSIPMAASVPVGGDDERGGDGAGNGDPDRGSSGVGGVADVLRFLLDRTRLLEYIPRSARAACSTLLSSLIVKLLRDPGDTSAWVDSLAFGLAILAKLLRSGRRHNVTNLIKKR